MKIGDDPDQLGGAASACVKLCRVLGVARSAYYAAQHRRPRVRGPVANARLGREGTRAFRGERANLTAARD